MGSLRTARDRAMVERCSFYDTGPSSSRFSDANTTTRSLTEITTAPSFTQLLDGFDDNR